MRRAAEVTRVDVVPPDLVVTIGRRDLGWQASPAAYSLTVSLVGDMRLFYVPDLTQAETWVYRWTPDHQDRREALTGLVGAGGLSGAVETRPFAAMAEVAVWVKARAQGIDSWMDLDGSGSLDALSAVGVVESLIPADVWERLVHRRTAWQSERDRATWRRAQREVAGLAGDQESRRYRGRA